MQCSPPTPLYSYELYTGSGRKGLWSEKQTGLQPVIKPECDKTRLPHTRAGHFEETAMLQQEIHPFHQSQTWVKPKLEWKSDMVTTNWIGIWKPSVEPTKVRNSLFSNGAYQHFLEVSCRHVIAYETKPYETKPGKVSQRRPDLKASTITNQMLLRDQNNISPRSSLATLESWCQGLKSYFEF